MKFRVMTEKTIYVPYFKTFDAPTMEDAERLAEVEVEGMTMAQDLPDFGWSKGSTTTDYEVKHDVTEALPDGGGR